MTEMSGQSGCRVLLYRDGLRHFVRKISASIEYNPRLERQREKQQRLADIVETPSVLDEGEINRLAYFDMTYVRGHDFKTYVPHQSVTSLSQLCRRILMPLELLAATTSGSLPAERFAEKVSSVSAAVRAGPFFAPHRAALEPILNFLQTADWSGIPASQCHGDLTLENLIITDDCSVVMIDLLDSDLDSVWLDAAKLLHDLDSGWSLRSLLWKHETSSTDRLVSMLSRYLYEELSADLAALLPGLEIRLTQLRALQAARVLPYIADEHVFWHATRRLDRLFQQEAR